jgi:Flp pilus assembly secretin CpaC
MRESDSIVQAKNGQIIVIGGLMQTIREEGKNGIPWLSELPYLGWLFRTNTGVGKKTELVEKKGVQVTSCVTVVVEAELLLLDEISVIKYSSCPTFIMAF